MCLFWSGSCQKAMEINGKSLKGRVTLKYDDTGMAQVPLSVMQLLHITDSSMFSTISFTLYLKFHTNNPGNERNWSKRVENWFIRISCRTRRCNKSQSVTWKHSWVRKDKTYWETSHTETGFKSERFIKTYELRENRIFSWMFWQQTSVTDTACHS